MKCPKCHYLSFEPEPRCRNCGYDLELADADLMLRTPDPEETPVRDLRLHDRAEDELAALVGATSATSVRPMAEPVVRAPRVPRAPRSRGPAVAIAEAPSREPVPGAPVAIPVSEAAPDPVPVPVSLEIAPAPPPQLVAVPPRPGRAQSTTGELPLFVKGILNDPARDPDEPLVAAPAVARPPLSVRRRAPEPVRLETPAPEVLADRPASIISHVPPTRDAVAGLQPSDLAEAAQARAEARALVRATQREAHGDAVSPITRLAAAAIDFGLLAGIALGVGSRCASANCRSRRRLCFPWCRSARSYSSCPWAISGSSPRRAARRSGKWPWASKWWAAPTAPSA
jgi:hypothetical protein